MNQDLTLGAFVLWVGYKKNRQNKDHQSRAKLNVGIYLGTSPQSGGQFQYDMSLLKAADSLCSGKVKVYAFYWNDVWNNYISDGNNIIPIQINWGFFQRGLHFFMRRLPVSIVRLLYLDFHPFGRLLKYYDIDLMIYPSVGELAYMCPISSIATIHDLMHRYESRFSEVTANGEYRRREKRYCRMVKYADIILVDSEVGKLQVLESYGAESQKVKILPHVPPYFLQKIEPKDVIKKYGLPEKYLFYPAQFWSHKNHKNLLHAIKLLIGSIPDLHIVFTGSKKNGYEAVLQLINELGLNVNVLILGYVSEQDKVALYKNAVALVMPTFFGPTNIPPLEAFILGCPVICSGIYAMAEELGNAAIYCDPNSPQSIADAILKVWNDEALRKTLIQRGYEQSAKWTQKDFNQRFIKAVEMLDLGKSTSIGLNRTF